MSASIVDVYHFIKECGPFVISTVTSDLKPNSRPFGAIGTDSKSLFVATNCNKNVFKEISQNNNVMIYALKPGTRDWVRVNAIASVTTNHKDILRLFEDNKVLYQKYNGISDPDLRVLKLSVTSIEKY